MAAARRRVTTRDAAEGIARLNLPGKVVELHVSLRSFPRLDGGPRIGAIKADESGPG
jgi:hypothetical protein